MRYPNHNPRRTFYFKPLFTNIWIQRLNSVFLELNKSSRTFSRYLSGQQRGVWLVNMGNIFKYINEN